MGHGPGVLADLALEPQSGALPETRGTRTHMFLQENGTPAERAGCDTASGYWIAPELDDQYTDTTTWQFWNGEQWRALDLSDIPS